MILPDVRQQEAFDCGAAAVKTVCDYFGIEQDRDVLIQSLGTNPINGTDPRTIEAFLRKAGLKVLSGDMRLADLKHLLQHKTPVICLVTLRGIGHYVVAQKVNRSGVSFQDPATGPERVPVRKFIECWVDFDRFGLTYRNFGMAVWK